MKRAFILLLLILFSFSLTVSAQTKPLNFNDNPEYLHRAIKEVTDVMVHDVYSPPVASRIYAYVCVAAYEACVTANYPTFISLAGQLHGLQPLPKPDAAKPYSYSLAAVHALLTVAKAMIISEDKIEDFHTKILQEIKDAGMPADVFDNSIVYGKQVADQVLAWSSADFYKQTRSYPKYAVSEDAASWKPTPPSYMKAIEPHWNKMRTFIIDSIKAFQPVAATAFSTDSNSAFYKEVQFVYRTSQKLTAEQKAMANFWDCNPFKMNINGHVMYATKKISPGGHWINITRLACKKANANFAHSAEAYTCVSIAIADAFISCWDEKYRSTVIRPETYINQYIDADWLPLLQTPPFPEYTSGHSVVSSASAVVLTKLFGENFSYTDSTEMEFNLTPRSFTSFKQASEEAAISRLYGGIHYMPSITNGIAEGTSIGKFIMGRLRTRQKNIAVVE